MEISNLKEIDVYKSIYNFLKFKMGKIVIKENNCSMKEFCALCGESMKNNMPLGLFLDGTWNSVCIECAEKENIDIVMALHSFYNSTFNSKQI